MQQTSLETIAASIGIGRDIIQIVFYVIASVVACIGLQKWRAELKGKVEYEAAKQALAQSYCVRDQIWKIQNGIVFSSEWAGYEPKGDENPDQRKASERFFAYGKRFQVLQENITGMYPAMVEAEAVFGEESRRKLDRLIIMTGRLWAAIVVYHQGLYKGSPSSEGANSRFFNIVEGLNNIKDPRIGAEENIIDDGDFKKDLDTAMHEIQEYFIPKLGRKPPLL